MTQYPDSRVLAERVQSGRLSGFQNTELYEAQDTGFFGSIPSAFKTGTTGQFYRTLAMPLDRRADPNWRGLGGLDAETRNELLDGISPEYYDLFVDANSLQDARNIKRRALMVQEAERTLAEAGWSGFASRFVATALDPIDVAVFAGSAGLASPIQAGQKANKLRSFVQMGLVTGGTGGVLELYAGQDDPNRGFYEASFATLTTGLFGGAIGSFSAGSHNKALLAEALERRSNPYRVRAARTREIERLTAIGNDIRRLERSMLREVPDPITYTPLGERYFANLNRDAEAGRIMATAEGLGYEAAELREIQLAIGRGEFDDLLRAMGEGPDPDALYAKLNGLTEEEARQIRHGQQQAAEAARAAAPEGSAPEVEVRDVQAGDWDATPLVDDVFDPRTPDPGNPDLTIDPANLNAGDIRYQKVRFGFTRQLADNPSETAKLAGSALVEDAVYKLGRIRTFAASTWTAFKRRTLTNNWLRDIVPDIQELTGRRWFQRSRELAEHGSSVRDAIIRGGSVNKNIDNIAKRSAELMDHVRQLAKRMGVRGFENVEANPNYFPRIYNTRKMYDAIESNGLASVEKWFAGAYRAANPEVSEEIAEKVGKGMVNIIMDTDRLSAIERMGALSGDRLDILDEALREVLDGDVVDALVGRIREQGTGSGQPRPTTGRAMKRTVLDELHRSDDGLVLDNFVETNAFDVVQRYVNEVVGAASEAEVLRAVGQRMGRKFETRGQLMAQVEREIRDAMPPGTKRDRLIRKTVGDYGILDRAFRAAAGRSMNPDNTANEIARNIRLFTHSLFNGTFGAASMPETGTAIASAFPQFVKMVPELGNIVKAALGKEVKPGFIKEAAIIHQHTMAGKSVRLAGLHDLGEVVEDASTMVGRRLRQMAEFSDVAGLLEPVTATQRTLVTSLAWQKFYDIAKGGKPLSPKRLANMGLDEAMANRILKNMRTHATEVDGAFGQRLANVNLHKWEKDVAAAFVFATEQWSRRAVQDVNIGSLAPWMTNEWARIITQYRIFPLAAYENHLLNNLSLHDAQVGMEMMAGMTLAASTYVAQVYRQSVGQKDRDKFLEEKLAPDKIMRVAFQRAGAFSLMPDAIDFAGSLAGVGPIFTERNTGLSRARVSVEGLLSNPTFATINSGFRLAKDVSGQAQMLIGDPLGTGSTFTDADFRNLRKLVPLNRVAGVDNFMRGIERMFPEEKK